MRIPSRFTYHRGVVPLATRAPLRDWPIPHGGPQVPARGRIRGSDLKKARSTTTSSPAHERPRPFGSSAAQSSSCRRRDARSGAHYGMNSQYLALAVLVVLAASSGMDSARPETGTAAGRGSPPIQVPDLVVENFVTTIRDEEGRPRQRIEAVLHGPLPRDRHPGAERGLASRCIAATQPRGRHAPREAGCRPAVTSCCCRGKW